MSWLPKKDTPVIGQGITGTEGTIGLNAMRAYGTNVVAGVTPGKGGQNHHGVPIFNTVAEALAFAPGVGVCIQFVPAPRVLAAGLEAIAARIPLLVIGAEKVPTRDTAILVHRAREAQVRILGPASLGCIGPHENIKIGFIGGATPERAFKKGSVAIVSKSGGMTSEIGIHLQSHNLGVSWAFGTGGERIIASDFADIATALETDEHTKATVIFGEFGGTAEERLADAVIRGDIKKPIVAYIVGEFAATLPEEIQFGHAGAILEAGRGTASHKKERLRAAGVTVVDDFDTIGARLHGILGV